MESVASVRIDKWLWAVRLYKSRSIATEACSSGKVQIGGQPVKASRNVRLGDVITAATGHISRTVKVLGLIENRVGAKLVPHFLEDLTPKEEYEKRQESNLTPFVFRPKGAGRPTKKDRRSLDDLLH